MSRSRARTRARTRQIAIAAVLASSLLGTLAGPALGADTTPPTVTGPALSSASVTQTTPLTVTTTANDDVGVAATEVRVDGGAWSRMSDGTALFGNVIQVRSGSTSSCAVLAGGTVRCWGQNGQGQLGDGTQDDRMFPTPVSGVTTATDVVVGGSHACALLSNHTIKCWGDNSEGQMGIGTTSSAPKTTPVAVSGITTAVAVAAGLDHTCAVLSDRTVRCWGYNNGGQIGKDYNVTTRATSPVAVALATGAVAITAGDEHTCILVTNATVKCWGYNDDLQLGRALDDFASFEPLAVPGISGATSIEAGAFHTCARLATGTLKCWGRNSDAALGNGTRTRVAGPVTVSGITTASAVTAGRSHTCARLADGSAKCWGSNARGEVGDGTVFDRTTPSTVKGVSGVAGISAGTAFTCARLEDGSLRCWGLGDRSRLGFPASTLPVRVSGITTAIAIGVGAAHSCAVLADGSVRCWGRNDWGQVGDGSRADRGPTAVKGLTGAVAVDGGEDSTCAVRSDGTVRCWGSDSETYESDVPITIVGVSGATRLGFGSGHACAVVAAGAVRCWGRNDTGQLGDGTTAVRTGPVSTTGLSGAIAVAGGTFHTCALLAGGGVKCWGNNRDGEIGDGTTIDRLTATSVTGITTATSLAVGYEHACARLGDGTVVCWGHNDEGQFGAGPCGPCSAPTPQPVPGITTAVSVSAGAHHTCARLADGSVTCWGANDAGQLGDGSTAQRDAPVKVQGITTATALSLGEGHGCALLADQTMRCWGAATDGQLGGPVATPGRPVGVFGGLAAGSHEVCVRARDTSGNVSDGTACATVTVADKTGPTTSPVAASLRTDVALNAGSLRVVLSWTAADNFGGVGIDRYEIQRSTDGGTTWSTLSSTLTAASATISVTPTGTVRFRVRAIDKGANVGSWGTGPVLTPKLIQESGVTFGGTWTTATGTSYSGGASRYSTAAGASATYAFTGSSIALVTSRSSTRGAVKVYLDGTLVSTLDTYSATGQNQLQAFAKTWSTSGSHSIKLVVVGTSGRPRVDVDALAVLAGTVAVPPPTTGGGPSTGGGGPVPPGTDTVTPSPPAAKIGLGPELALLALLGSLWFVRGPRREGGSRPRD